MRKFAAGIALSTFIVSSVWALPPDSAAPQTARQALMEMFSGKQGSFMKHLPAATIAAMEKSGALASLQQYSALAGHLQTQKTEGSSFESFETGAVMLTISDAKGQKLEIVVENDSLQGDEDSIEVSFQTYKEKVVQHTPYLPRMTFVMKSETGVWKLNEVLFTVRVPLADPDFLKSITDGIKSRASAPNPTLTQGIGQKSAMQSPMMQTSLMQASSAQATGSLGNDAPVLGAMRTILAAETTYSRTYHTVGYACTLSDLDGFGGGGANEHQAMLIPSGLAGGKKYGYIFALSGCTGNPAAAFHLTAVPAGNNFGRKVFCADQSGAIRYSADGNPASCLAGGVAEP